jgi:hypothetical protein
LLDSLKKQKGIEGIKIVIADCSTGYTRKVIENHKGWVEWEKLLKGGACFGRQK